MAEAGRHAWVDWQDIPPTAEWLTEIFTAIVATDAFVLIISPDSMTSSVCRKEVAHALEHNRRVVPVVHHDVRPEDVPDEIAALNWIFLRESDNFGEGFSRLLDALDTDLEWVRAHTRVLLRAREWEKAGRDKSLLMRGVT